MGRGIIWQQKQNKARNPENMDDKNVVPHINDTTMKNAGKKIKKEELRKIIKGRYWEMKISEHFDDSEFTCHCGCGQIKIFQELVDMLENFRARVGKPVIVHCINRCPQHNADVGGVEKSLHIDGMACDCHVKGIPIKELHAIALSSEDILFGGIGIYDWGIHVDIGAKRMWSEVK